MILKFIFILNALLIFNGLIGYPLVLMLLDKFGRKKLIKKDLTYRPSLSLIIAAHNEEKSIGAKLENMVKLDYPSELLEIIIASDRSTDRTHEIVEGFIEANPDSNIRLLIMEERGGKTPAQNSAVKKARGEILVFSDANAMLDEMALKELVSFFTQDDVVYVTGRLAYVNEEASEASASEATYWDLDLFMRRVESQMQTIVAGNGALYAIRAKDYVDFPAVYSHDSAMPYHVALNHKRALYNEKALAYERASSEVQDEFRRKVRMFRSGISPFLRDLKKYNPFKYGWYSYFYFSHRASRRSLFLFHMLVLGANLFLRDGIFGVFLVLQLAFYGLALLSYIFKLKGKVFYYPYYYSMTILAQLLGAFRSWTKQVTPHWEKSQSTRD